MGIEEILQSRRDEILDLAAQHRVSNVRVFGSVARGESRADSDVDFLVQVAPEAVWDLMALWGELEDLLDRKVGLIPEDCLLESLREPVLRDAVALSIFSSPAPAGHSTSGTHERELRTEKVP